MLKLCSLDIFFISLLLINKIENTIIWITETLFWRRILGVGGEGRFSSKCISFSIFFLVMLWGGGWVGGVASCNVDFFLSFYKNIFWTSTLHFNCLKAQCQKFPLSERGRYPKKYLRTCFHLNNSAIFFSAEKVGFVPIHILIHSLSWYYLFVVKIFIWKDRRMGNIGWFTLKCLLS